MGRHSEDKLTGKYTRMNNKEYNILVLGSDGMLGYDVMNTLPRLITNTIKLKGLDIDDGYDFTDNDTLVDIFEHSEHYDYVINCIAYTDTKSAETTEDGKELSYELNAIVPKNLAYACNMFNTKLIHISTDWVFSQKTGNTIFRPFDTPYPVNQYGKDKLLGEQFIETEFGNHTDMFTILRVSWLYGMHKNKSFIHKFLTNLFKNLNEGKKTLDMTSNEYSIPTSTDFVVDCISESIKDNRYGILHAVPELSKELVSRYDYANAILSKFSYMKVLKDVKLNPIEISSFYPVHSTMFTDFKNNMSWNEDLDRFVKKNEDKLQEFVSDIV